MISGRLSHSIRTWSSPFTSHMSLIPWNSSKLVSKWAEACSQLKCTCLPSMLLRYKSFFLRVLFLSCKWSNSAFQRHYHNRLLELIAGLSIWNSSFVKVFLLILPIRNLPHRGCFLWHLCAFYELLFALFCYWYSVYVPLGAFFEQLLCYIDINQLLTSQLECQRESFVIGQWKGPRRTYTSRLSLYVTKLEISTSVSLGNSTISTIVCLTMSFHPFSSSSIGQSTN